MRRFEANLSLSLSLGSYKVMISFLVMLVVLYLPTAHVFLALIHSCADSKQSAVQASGESGWEVLNLDGDVSLSAHEDEKYWNPHMVGFTRAMVWSVSFSDEVLIILETIGGEAGHVATGMWWTAGFKSGAKIPLCASMPSQIHVDLNVRVDTAEYEGSDEWLRIALACAVQRADGSVVYTEMDIWDSSNTQRHPSGSARLGGDIIYQGRDVLEFKIDQIPLGTWKHYHVDLTSFVDRAWKIRAGDRLESVYIVVESINNPVKVVMRVNSFWIKRPID